MNDLSALDGQLLEAIEHKDLVQVEHLLIAGANPNITQGDQTAFQLVPHGEKEIQCALIEAGAQDPSLKHALVWVIGTGRVAAVKKLIELGSDINVKTFSGTPIQCAAKAGHLEIVEILISAGADLDTASSFSTALTSAIERGHFKIALKLIAAGADPNLTAEYSTVTPLALAAIQGSQPVIQALIQAGADINHVIPHITINQVVVQQSAAASLQSAFQALKTINGLMQSLDQVEEEIVPAELMGEIESSMSTLETRSKLEKAALPEAETTADTSALILAARCGHAEAVITLLAAGANAGFKDGDGLTAYAWALRKEQSNVLVALRHAGVEGNQTSPEEHLISTAEQGDVNMLNYWISQGADLNTRDTRRTTKYKTPLTLAATAGHLSIVEALLSAGANVNLGDADESSPKEVSKSLLYHMGADPEGLISMGYQLNRTALMWATANGHREVVSLLIQHQANLQSRDILGQSALLIASENGHIKVVEILLDAGMPIDDLDNQKETPLLLALAGKHLDLANFLLDRGSDVNAQSKSGYTPLMWAAQNNYLDLIGRLIELGADINATNKGNESALYYADLFDNHDAIALLKKHGAIELEDEDKTEDESDEEDRWGEEIDRPDFSEAAQNPEYQAAVAELGKRCGSEPVATDDVPGFFSAHVNSKCQAEIDIEVLQTEFLQKGCFVYEPCYGHGKVKQLAILPTTDKYEVIAFHQTNGVNCGIGPGYILEWLKQLEIAQPFVLTCIAYDTLAGRFLTPIADPEGLAEEMDEFCPDIVSQGCGEVEILAEQLESNDNLFFWWD
jgi:ankyrin repeat protein